MDDVTVFRFWESRKTRTKLPSQMELLLMIWPQLSEFQIVPSTSAPSVSIWFSPVLVGKHINEKGLENFTKII